MKKTVLREYAKLIAKMGVNIQKGQEVMIIAELDQPEFVEMLVQECYKCKASKVTVQFEHQALTKLHVKYQTVKKLSTVEKWEEEKLKHRCKVLPCMIYLMSSDPDGLNGMNQEKNSKAIRAQSKILKPIRDRMENKYQWCIAAAAGPAWAKKMFPGVRTSKAMEMQWEAILKAARADGADPVADWEAHNADLDARCRYLNDLGIKELRYKSANGTDFTVGLMAEGRFCGGNETTLSGVVFNPNMPTEEVFVSPKKGEAEGIVYSSKPLSYRGELIENFSIRFEKGRAVEVHAEKGEDLLKEMIGMDEGAAYLGECALVPVNSPISASGLVFYDTLFDENASCHLAMGRGFNECVKDFDKYTLEELREMGINDSIIHVDFMIGTDDLSIDAVLADGTTVPVFRGGNWAF